MVNSTVRKSKGETHITEITVITCTDEGDKNYGENNDLQCRILVGTLQAVFHRRY